jgi:hypothetical protein
MQMPQPSAAHKMTANSSGSSSPRDPKDAEALAILREETAAYIGQMCTEMAGMARAAKLDLLSYFLEMGAAEAKTKAGEHD